MHVPKTAGQAIHRSVPRPRKNPWATHLTLEKLNDNSGKFSFAFVRNPWDRLVSLYHFMIQKPVVRDFNQQELINSGFKEAVLGLKMNGQRDARYWVEDCDYVGMFEYLQRDFIEICEYIGIEPRPVGKLNSSSHDHYSKYYDDETRDFVAERHAWTIEHYGYKFENPDSI